MISSFDDCDPRHSSTLQDGTEYDDKIFGATVGQDGAVFLFGATSYEWGDMYYGSADFIVAKLHSDGSLLWGWQVILAGEERNA